MSAHVSENNTRMTFTISKELKERSEKQAQKEMRSLSNLITVALEKYLSEQK